MLSQRFKLIFLQEGSSRKREYNFSRRLYWVCLGAFTLAFMLISITTGIFLYQSYSARAVNQQTHRNAELDHQLTLAEDKILDLTQRIEGLRLNNNDLRVYAQLPGLDEATQMMGIGGSLPYQEQPFIGAEDILTRLDELDRQISLQERSLAEVHEKIQVQEDYLRCVPSVRPVVGGSITSLFGRRRDPFSGHWEPHMGLDISGQIGMPVYSTADGRVVYVGRVHAYGKTVVIDHGNGYKTRFAHLNRYFVIKGQKITRGDLIAEMGNTGRSTGPHLHYEVIHKNVHLNPLDFMFDGYAMARLP
ncbi:M23 family metallopeptidase [bacterium]|nr:M23 family metallopeptidase [bacterium]MBU1650690.1 M23 family metallopeptidase [bacterium]MBU1880506.1 M23 family metallopeptidase [bacterium]